VINHKIIDNLESIEDNLDSIFPQKYVAYEIEVFSEHKNFKVFEVTPRINPYTPTIEDKIGFPSKAFQFDFYEINKSLFLVKSKNILLQKKDVTLLSKYNMIDSSFVDIDPETHMFELEFGVDSLENVKHNKLPGYVIDERVFTAYLKIYKDGNLEILGRGSD